MMMNSLVYLRYKQKTKFRNMLIVIPKINLLNMK